MVGGLCWRRVGGGCWLVGMRQGDVLRLELEQLALEFVFVGLEMEFVLGLKRRFWDRT